MDLGHRGKTVIVTGGSKGIGSGISEAFAKEGANLVINYHSDSASSEAFSKELMDKYGCKAICVQGDVGNEADVKSIFDAAEEYFDRVDILINNAGKVYTNKVTDISLEEWNKCLKDNLTGQFLMSREFARRVVPKKQKGWIVNVVSKAAMMSTTKGRLAYVSNKAGEWGLTHALAVELTEYGIRVNGVMPGHVMNSRLIKEMENNPEGFKQRINRSPIKRVGEPWEIGNMVAFLASEQCALAVGSVVDVTGGLLLGF